MTIFIPPPLVTIGLLTWQGAATLPACLASLHAQTYRTWELVACDNGSTDGSAALVASWAAKHVDPPRVRLVVHSRNRGYAAGMNAIARRSQGDYLLALNQDAALHPKFLEQAVAALRGHPEWGAVCGRTYRSADLAADFAVLREASDLRAWGSGRTLDSTGHLLYRDRVVMNRRGGEPDGGQDLAEEALFGVPGAAALYRMEALKAVACDPARIWDERFFAYLEDVDLDYRFHAQGWSCGYRPNEVALHQPHGSGGRRTLGIRFRAHMNRYRLMAKHETPLTLLPDLGPILLQEVYQLLRTTLTQPLLHFAALPFLAECLTGRYLGGPRWRRELVERAPRWQAKRASAQVQKARADS